MVIPGKLDSHEIADSRHPLLLSQACQAKMGFMKSSRSGTITLEDYDHQEVEVVRQARTGLFMIRIDHLWASHYAGLHNEAPHMPFGSLLCAQPDVV